MSSASRNSSGAKRRPRLRVGQRQHPQDAGGPSHGHSQKRHELERAEAGQPLLVALCCGHEQLVRYLGQEHRLSGVHDLHSACFEAGVVRRDVQERTFGLVGGGHRETNKPPFFAYHVDRAVVGDVRHDGLREIVKHLLGVERSPQRKGDLRQKRVPARGLFSERLGAFAIGNLSRDFGGADDFALGIANRRDRQRDRDEGAALGPANGLEMIDALAGPDRPRARGPPPDGDRRE